jgi:Putative DNA-binding domain
VVQGYPVHRNSIGNTLASTELRSFFDALTTQASLEDLIAQKITESLYLEFKSKKDRSTPLLDSSDGWQFSRAISGFANSDGGILIWGIESNKHEEAAKLKPIANVADFHARLKKSLLNSTQPVVDGIILQVILTDKDNTDGYVTCLIPSSDKTPHRAMLADREYYKRTTEGFYRLEHFDLEDMFGRRPRPLLVVILKLIPHAGDESCESLSFSFQNTGRGIAKYSGFLCRLPEDVQVVSVDGMVANVSHLNQGAPVVSYQDNSNIFHPNNINYNIGNAVLKRATKGQQLSVRLSWYCENMLARSEIVDVQPEGTT